VNLTNSDLELLIHCVLLILAKESESEKTLRDLEDLQGRLRREIGDRGFTEMVRLGGDKVSYEEQENVFRS